MVGRDGISEERCLTVVLSWLGATIVYLISCHHQPSLSLSLSDNGQAGPGPGQQCRQQKMCRQLAVGLTTDRTCPAPHQCLSQCQIMSTQWVNTDLLPTWTWKTLSSCVCCSHRLSVWKWQQMEATAQWLSDWMTVCRIRTVLW